MKITIEFEDADLREMLTEHMLKGGFSVLNMDALCEAFAQAFPEGLRVHAGVAEMPAPVEAPPSPVLDSGPELPLNTMHTPESEEEGPLSFDDLMDPTPRLGRTELRVARNTDTGDDIRNIIRKSNAIERVGRTDV